MSMQMQEYAVTVGDAYYPVSLRTLLVDCSHAYADAVFDSSTSLLVGLAGLESMSVLPNASTLYMFSSHDQKVAALHQTFLLYLSARASIARLQ